VEKKRIKSLTFFVSSK